jgi:hypothetical protein
MPITEQDAILNIKDKLAVNEEEAKIIYKEQIETLRRINEIPLLEKQVHDLQTAFRNLFAIMDSALPEKIQRQPAYIKAKTLVNGTN